MSYSNSALPTTRGVNGKSIAIAIVDTSQHILANNALLHSIKAFDFKQILIFSDIQQPWANNKIIQIPTIRRIEDYNKIIATELPKHLTSDYCLVIQYDGFILNSDEFSPHFFQYDYIGAPWPHFDTMSVGNGGFSWRSRKLIEAVAELDYSDLSIAEDIFICRNQRIHLERNKSVEFAPKDIAAHFSVESVPVRFPTFGFHGVFHLPAVYRNSIDFLIENIDLQTAKRWRNLLLPAIERISTVAAASFNEKLLSAQ